MGKNRNYKDEHERRKATKRRLLVDLEKDKAAAFLALLDEKGLTFAEWINNMIDKEIN